MAYNVLSGTLSLYTVLLLPCAAGTLKPPTNIACLRVYMICRTNEFVIINEKRLLIRLDVEAF